MRRKGFQVATLTAVMLLVTALALYPWQARAMGPAALSSRLTHPALDPPQPYTGKLPGFRLEALSVEHGLSHNTVYAIVQDRQGYLWFGTQDGLSRYDGYHFTEYRHDPDDPQTLSDNAVLALYVDRSGSLWAGTRQGLNRLDEGGRAFVRYRQDPSDPQSLGGKEVRAILEDRAENLWVGTLEGGLSRLDRKSQAFTHFRHDPGDPSSLSDNSVLALYEDRSGTLWIGTQSGGLNSLDPANGTITRYEMDPANLDRFPVKAIFEDSQGRLWIGSDGSGLHWLDRTSQTFTSFRNDPDDASTLIDNRVQTILEDGAGRLWVGTKGGANLWDQDHAAWHFYKSVGDLYNLNSNWVTTLYEDRSGVVWLGTAGGGLNKYSRTQDRFALYTQRPNYESISANMVTAILEDRQGLLWVGTVAGGLNMIDRKNQSITQYYHNSRDPNSISSNDISALVEDSQGDLWIGTLDSGLNFYSPERKAVLHYRHNPADRRSLSEDWITALYQDSSGVLWVGTGSGGLNRLDRNAGVFERYRYNPEDPNSLSHNRVNAIFEDRHGNLWIGTQAGVNRWMGEGKFQHYRSAEGEIGTARQGSLSNDIVNAFSEDPSGVLWIGTDGGLNRFDPSTETFAVISEEDGLPDDVINGILADEKGHLWLSTNRGLSNFDPQSGRFRNYDVHDGLQSSQFNPGAYFESPSGEMFFGGIQGFNAFFPQRVKALENRLPPPVVITAIKKGSQILGENLSPGESLQLSYQDHFISFEFSALDYTVPEKNQYMYKLDGVDEDWVDAGTRNFASYTNLSGGNYIFRVRGANSDGVWNEEGLAIAITVTPPFWETVWFRGLAVLALLGGGLGTYRLRVKSIQARNRALEHQVALRTVVLMKEIEQRQRAEQELQASEAKYRELVENADSVILQMDLDGNITFFNRFAQEFFGYREEEILGRSAMGTIVPAADQSGNDLHAKLRDILQHPDQYYSSENENIRRNGERVWVAWTNKAVYDKDGKLAEILCIGIDRTEQKRAESALAQQLEEKAAEAERSRLARELHDSVSQALYGIVLGTRTAQKLLEQDPGQAAAPLDYVFSLAQGGMAEMKALIFELRPESLEKEGLVAALTKQAAALQARYEIEVQASLCEEPEVSLAVKEALYRIAQEAQHNIVKHARATRVELLLECKQGEITLEVKDNGAGFDPQGDFPGHLGLKSMRERAERLGGKFELESAPGEGTCLKGTIPVKI